MAKTIRLREYNGKENFISGNIMARTICLREYNGKDNLSTGVYWYAQLVVRNLLVSTTCINSFVPSEPNIVPLTKISILI